MKWFGYVFAVVDFVASTIGWIIIATVLICALNGGKIEFTNKGESHCFGKCEVTHSK